LKINEIGDMPIYNLLVVLPVTLLLYPLTPPMLTESKSERPFIFFLSIKFKSKSRLSNASISFFDLGAFDPLYGLNIG